MENYVRSISEASYHRNGVGGVGFYVIRFIMEENGQTATAVVFGDSDDVGQNAGYCAVMTEKMTDHWRGDRFEHELGASSVHCA